MEPYIGQIIMFGGNFAIRGYALCNGQLLPIASNQALYSILGTTYGGDGRTTFALPDLRGRAPIHFGHGAGLTNRTLGQKSGSETVTLAVGQIPSHNHAANCVTAGGNQASPGGHLWAADAGGFTKDYSDQAAGGTMNATAIANTGGGQGHPNMPPFQVINLQIALTGVYPSRS